MVAAPEWRAALVRASLITRYRWWRVSEVTDIAGSWLGRSTLDLMEAACTNSTVYWPRYPIRLESVSFLGLMAHTVSSRDFRSCRVTSTICWTRGVAEVGINSSFTRISPISLMCVRPPPRSSWISRAIRDRSRKRLVSRSAFTSRWRSRRCEVNRTIRAMATVKRTTRIPRNQARCQRKGLTDSPSEAPTLFHTPESLLAVTLKVYSPAGSRR